MAKKGAYISDVKLLEDLSQTMRESTNAMADIHENISSYINRVNNALDRQLDFLREKLEEAEARLSQAESALSSCQASQVFIPEIGGYVPTCISEEVDVASAREEVMEWQHKYSEGQRIVGECQNEISEFDSSSGGRGLIEKMNSQAFDTMDCLSECVSKLRDILATDVQVRKTNSEELTGVMPTQQQSSQISKDKRFDLFRNNIHGSHK